MSKKKSKMGELRKNKKEIIRKYNVGYSTDVLSKQYDCPHSFILKILHENDVVIRKRANKQERNKLMCNIIADLLSHDYPGQYRAKTLIDILFNNNITTVNKFNSTLLGRLLNNDDRFDYVLKNNQRHYYLKGV